MKEWAAIHQDGGAHQGVIGTNAATGPETLSYGGGTSSSSQGNVGVMSGRVKVYLVYYGNQWGTRTTNGSGDSVFTNDSYGAAAKAEEMFKGIGTNNELWSADLTQWCDGPNVSAGATSCPSNANFVPYQSGGVLSGVWYDNSAASPSAATGAQLAQEAVKAAGHFGNTTAASNRYAYYVIMSPTGTNPDNYQGQYCAWHDWNGDSSLTGGAVSSSYGDLAFSNQPYNMDSGSGCGVDFVNAAPGGDLDGYTMTLGHEWHEMMSDTFPAGGWTNQTGNATYNGQENSDECAWIAAGSAGGAANIAFATGTFTEQASWSNDTNACSISHPIVGGGSSGGTPTANFTFTTSGLTATFTDSSTDSGGSISAHSWTFGDGGTSTAASPSHTYAAAGTYSVSETVTDGVSNKTSTKTSSVTVTNPGGTPTANFGFTTNGLTATFTDSSTDNGGTIGSHSWTFGDGGTSTATSPSHTYAAAGTYSVTETVTDSVSGKTSSKTASVTVATAGGTPTANFTFTTSGLTATFTDSSTDSGGTIGSHSWTFGDGATSTATSPSHAYAAAGTYSVTETVTDSVSGKTSSKTASVTVSSGGGGGSTQLLSNPSFESTLSPWAATSGVDCSTGCSGESAHTGVGFAWLDGYGSSHTDTLSQKVTITAGKTSATLSYYLHVDTAETTTTTAYDKLTVAVYSSTGSLLKTLSTYSNLNAASGYAVHTNDLSAYIGQTVTIKFTGTEDVSLQTSFVLDDVTLTVQ